MPQNSEIDHWLDRAIALHQRNRTAEARPLYEKVLKARPSDPDANHLLGLIDQSDGNLKLALERITKARALDPKNAVLLNNLGGLYRDLGQTDEAIKAFEAGLAVDGRVPALHNNLGVAYQQAGRHEEAIASFEKALVRNPNYAEAHNNLGLSLLKCDRPDEAVKAFEKALSIAPNYANALGNLGAAFVKLDKHGSAVRAFRSALEYGPVAGLYDNLGTSLSMLDRFEEALDAHNQALRLEPQNADYLAHRASVFISLSRAEEARDSIEQALRLDDRLAQAHYLNGLLLGQNGDRKGAVGAFQTALGIDPDLAEVYRSIAWAGRFSGEDEMTSQMRSAYARSEPGSENRMHLAFALGKIEEDQQAFDKAFAHFSEGNAIRRQRLTYSSKDVADAHGRMRRLFTSDLFARLKDVGHRSADPIFIIGMPRSGTTLTETIIASHRDVTAGGELSFFGAAAKKAGLSDGGFPPVFQLPADPGLFAEMAEDYLGRARQRTSAPSRFTDKLPANYAHAGLIHLAFPNAKIIHCRRSPLDTCWSIFKLYFPAKGLRYAYDLTELGAYYRLYEKLMQHWDTVMPGVIHTIDYETLVANPEEETRKLIAYCGLDWDDACLSFYASKRTVQTASVHQVRQPIYKSSINLAERYGDALAPLVKALATDPLPDDV